MAIRRYCRFQFCIKGGEGFQDGISFWFNGKEVGSIKKENKITFPDQYIWSHFLKVGKKLNQTVPMSPCSRGGSPVWNSHAAVEASTPPPSPLRAPRPALQAGLQGARSTPAAAMRGVVSGHREEAALLFFLLNLESTFLNWHMNRLFITDQNISDKNTFFLCL